jgi:hypothetical protein
MALRGRYSMNTFNASGKSICAMMPRLVTIWCWESLSNISQFIWSVIAQCGAGEVLEIRCGPTVDAESCDLPVSLSPTYYLAGTSSDVQSSALTSN